MDGSLREALRPDFEGQEELCRPDGAEPDQVGDQDVRVPPDPPDCEIGGRNLVGGRARGWEVDEDGWEEARYYGFDSAQSGFEQSGRGRVCGFDACERARTWRVGGRRQDRGLREASGALVLATVWNIDFRK